MEFPLNEIYGNRPTGIDDRRELARGRGKGGLSFW